ncbi:glycerol-3-phosphate acyltransferase [Lysobacter concretionis Ko07 = DSM 16239]|uniref:Glycerol-3-phosphate acyltransferase n=1 Tax=Lysobacter concretionis Ko07 = DSM 16239 TaxID=1122185 RepID=A0A0A0EUC0_9GAMM|nr:MULTISPECIES: glycerol-3-phosphate 1-O-acyltransferase PlsB [Lysobacter]KGM52747.1 glycerol-3-phosphate acyltransferase [Lysobacter concretionis Ko07 = DSM 16239]QOD91182.1 glycerol-3-phosphate 1-O-acyltransferase PlsB [Lysobacter sp. CW239]
MTAMPKQTPLPFPGDTAPPRSSATEPAASGPAPVVPDDTTAMGAPTAAAGTTVGVAAESPTGGGAAIPPDPIPPGQNPAAFEPGSTLGNSNPPGSHPDDGVGTGPAGRPPGSGNPRRPWWARLLGRMLAPWISLTVEPANPAGYAPQLVGQPVCYVIEHYGLSNALILERACLDSGLPSPLQPLPGDPLGRKRAYVALSRRNASALGPLQHSLGTPLPSSKSHSSSLARLLDAHRADASLDVQLVPVSIFVGRAPDKTSGWFSVLFSENWTLVGRFRRLLAILLNGRATTVRFAPPISLRGIVAEDLPPERTVRKLSRVLRTHFRRIRAAVIGPDLSTRRLLVDKVLAAEPVKEAIADQARRDNSSVADAWKKAHGYAYEIAADYSHPVVRSASFLLTFVWNRIYRGVLVHHLDKVKQAAPGHEVIYVPCHRSHMDYLLLSYLLYTRGIVPPHIVAGINLNLPVIGTVLRKGGAFFIRRSIRGSALYSTVLSEYVAKLVAGGYSIEYFVEGGRSRTGRLLPPKGGMVSMTVRAFLRQPTRPVLFQPVYIGYEKLMEGNSYLDELSGKQKESESIWQLLTGIPKVLRSNYGQVVVNFGEPIKLDDVLAEHAPDWEGKALGDDEKPAWLSGTVDSLAQRIQVNVNRAADVNPINLLALALLSTPKHAMGEGDLLAQIWLSKTLLAELPYSDRVTVTPHTPAQIIAHGEDIGVLTRTAHPLGDVLQVGGDQSVLLSYFRNNVLHLFTAASWIACCFQNNRRMAQESVLRLGRSVYPFLQTELFLPWSEDEFVQRLTATIDIFVREGLLERVNAEEGGILARNAGQSDEVFRLRAIGHSLQQAFERYYITISVLVKNGSGTLSTGQLESLCQLAAQRLSLLYAPAAPEFFDKTLFRGFIQKLRELSLVRLDENAKLVFEQPLEAWARDAKFILGRELRHSIEKVSPEAARPEPDALPVD